MNIQKSILGFLALTTGALSSVALAANNDKERFSVGGGLAIMLGNGVPANDMPAQFAYGQWHWRGPWSFAASIANSNWDFEGPAALLGISQSTAVEVIDHKVSQTELSVWAERDLWQGDKWRYFAQFGLGVADADANDVAGPVTGGGQFNIAVDLGTTPFGIAAIGLRRGMGERWFIEGALRVRYMLADYRLLDTVSNRSTKVNGFFNRGFTVSLGYRF